MSDTPTQMHAAPPAYVNEVIARLENADNRLVCLRGGRRHECALRELLPDVNAVRHMLHQRGARSGQTIGLLAENSYEWLVFDLACLASGIVLAPFDTGAVEDAMRLRHALDLRLIFTDQGELWNEEQGILPLTVPTEAPATPPAEAHRYRPDEVIAIKFTSGSTGEPKALAARCKSVDASLDATQRMFEHGPRDRLLVFLPLYLLQQRYWLYSAILFRCELVVLPARLAVTALRREQPTVVMGVPEYYENLRTALWTEIVSRRLGRLRFETFRRARRLPLMSRLLGRHAVADRFLGGRIRYLWTGSAAMRRSTLEFFDDCGVPLYQGYGSNETCIVAKNHPGHNRLGSAGRVVPHKQVIIEADGHILVRSEFEINDRYLLCGPEDNANTFLADRTVATGDLGYLDADGYLFITGRRKELLVLSSGRKLHPAEIEDRIKTLAGVRHAVVMLTPERPGLYAIVDGEDRLDGGALCDHLRKVNQSLPPEARISRVRTVKGAFTQENGLLTSQYKIRRAAVADFFSTELNDPEGWLTP